MYNGQYVGNVSDPKVLLDQLTVPLQDIIGVISFILASGENETIFDKEFNQQNWTRSMHYYRGMCYHLHIPKELMEKGIGTVFLYLKQNALVFVHSHGMWRRSSHNEAQVMGTRGTGTYAKIDYSVYHLLDYLGESCDESDSYSFDDCFYGHLDDKILKETGCTTPFGLSTEKICKNQTQGFSASNTFFGLTKFKGSLGCRHPCSYVKVTKEKLEISDDDSNATRIYPGVYLQFDDEVTVIETQFAYSSLSLFAEIGGYIGLLLGVSVNQVSHLLNFVLSKIVNAL